MNKTQSSFEIPAIINNDKLPLAINKMGKDGFLNFQKNGGSKLMLQPNIIMNMAIWQYGNICIYLMGKFHQLAQNLASKSCTIQCEQPNSCQFAFPGIDSPPKYGLLHGLARPFLSSMFWQFLGPLKHEI
jgi:hypothetical protein